jgi:glycosyltransferase involved in cell wall biosynthesis
VNSLRRIALVVNPFTLRVKGGQHAPALARELLGSGYAVRGFGAPEGLIPRSGEELDDQGRPIGTGLGGILRFRPDLIVAYDALSPAAFQGARAARALKVPLVLVEAGFAGDGSWWERLLRRVGERLWGRFVRRMARRVVALDPVAQAQAVREGFDAERVVNLPSGVSLDVYRPGLSSSQVGDHSIHGRILLYVGRLTTGRGLEVLIESFAHTVGQRSDWSLVLAGDGPERARLRAHAGRLGIGSRVHWLGRPRKEELPGLMGAATLLAVPALDDTVRGKQIPRAMACGLPVIASRLPRFEFLVEDNESGLLVAAGDLSAWTAALGRAAVSPESRKRWGVRARQIAEQRLAWPVVARHFEELFLELHEESAEAAVEPRACAE